MTTSDGPWRYIFWFASIGPCRHQNVLPVLVLYWNLRLELASFFQQVFQYSSGEPREQKNMWKTFPWNTGYIIRILTMVYCNPYKNWAVNNNLQYNPTNQGFFRGSHVGESETVSWDIGKGLSGCWFQHFQPIWKICSSNWNSSPNRGENKKYSKPPPTWQFFLPSLGWLSDPFKLFKWPPTGGWKGHFESPGRKLVLF